ILKTSLPLLPALQRMYPQLPAKQAEAVFSRQNVCRHAGIRMCSRDDASGSNIFDMPERTRPLRRTFEVHLQSCLDRLPSAVDAVDFIVQSRGHGVELPADIRVQHSEAWETRGSEPVRNLIAQVERRREELLQSHIMAVRFREVQRLEERMVR